MREISEEDNRRIQELAEKMKDIDFFFEFQRWMRSLQKEMTHQLLKGMVEDPEGYLQKRWEGAAGFMYQDQRYAVRVAVGPSERVLP